MLKKSKKPKQAQKPPTVKIIDISAIALGGTMPMIWGLGDDQSMYLWSSERKIWLEG